jgi:uncharacterized membrane protein YtjA (UPF0391 family)
MISFRIESAVQSPCPGPPCVDVRASGLQQRADVAHTRGSLAMLKWAIIFFVISLIAGFLGFTNLAAGARGIAKILFFIALAIFLIILVFGVLLGVLVF